MYSDGSPVKASDFEHALRRVLGMASPAAPLYERIVGAIEYAQRGEPEADITGIETDDRTRRITIRLDRPYAAFDHLLAVPFATPVPADTPFRDMTKRPPPGTGPFRITESEPDRQFVLERNPRFASLGIEGVPEAKLDRITTKIIGTKTTRAQDVLTRQARLHERLAAAGPAPDRQGAGGRPLRGEPHRQHQLVLPERPRFRRSTTRASGRR